MLLHNPFAGAFGLNLGDASVKLIQLKQKSGLKKEPYFDVLTIREAGLPLGCIAKGEIQQPDIVVQTIQSLLQKTEREEKINAQWAVGSLPVTKSFLKLITIDTPKEKITGEIVALETGKHLPVDINNVYFDWQEIEDGNYAEEGKTYVVVAATPKNIVNSYTDIFIRAGIHPLALEVEELSIARAMVTAKKNYHGEARAILDLGSSRSSIIIYDKGSVQFSSLISVCGDLVDTALVNNLKIEREEAEKLKRVNGVTYDSANPKYLKTVEELVDRLVDEIRQVMNFYAAHFEKPNPITHITMSGGFAATKNLDKILSKKIGVDAYPGNAWKNLLNKNLRGKDRYNGLPMASAIGLALRAADWQP